ncbi:TetR/AcrR family transcriptional regulator [Amycolatopsis sp. NPDC059657]|uniref:TetR/AcrR family transcriptional regulator n=1 Tax=Amycolatopsis sp. NPDC059657 TaxID=3346899 RepID=UPI00366C5C72
MPIDRSSAGDPARTLELLWREPGHRPAARGPKQGKTVDEVVEAAIELADKTGIEAVTMRRVAEAVGVAPMSLYTYVPGKAELLDLMLDLVYQRMPRAAHDGKSWRERVRAVAEENRALYERHPWVANVSTIRPPLGPGLMAKYDHELQAFDGTPLDEVETDAALTYVLSFVNSASRAAAEQKSSQLDGLLGDDEWWAANEPLLTRVFDAEAHPTAARIGSAAGAAHQSSYNAEHAYGFGLDRVIDGLGVLIEGRAH